MLGPRYGASIGDLARVWNSLLDRTCSFSTAVFEEIEGAKIKIHGVGVSVFVTDDFLQEAKAHPSFWLGPELTRRIAKGRSPILSEKQVTAANTGEGLNLAIWQNSVSPEALRRPDIGELCVRAFLNNHYGYRLNEVISQAESPDHFTAMLNAGALYYDARTNAYRRFDGLDLMEVFAEPHLIGLDRKTAPRIFGSWLATLFIYRPPLLGFSRSEQRLLSTALEGGTDEALAHTLGISLFAVKKSWRAIYDRSTSRLPELFRDSSSSDKATQDRGKEKKRRIIAYLREHPEELRPVSRKLLSKGEINHFRSPADNSRPG